ncbi:hypothetical protein Kirov_214 [Bacillus phage Kirov]|uniref:Uncharacterized protein n=1 Tax=Bacillus phage Kirov TaxID=2783539 RepID=A0A7U3RX49_9CAUD|nr:hypothetical protein PQE67_gp090 [Bacillus phage Kirov]QOV08413.1 hypothetical protein Kirov_214 [Bacillus phage Kirov]
MNKLIDELVDNFQYYATFLVMICILLMIAL